MKSTQGQTDYKSILYRNYQKTHAALLDKTEMYEWSDDKEKFFEKYFQTYYKSEFIDFDSKGAILEIGCNTGYMLKIFERNGYNNLTGIDLSPDNIQIAKKNVKCSAMCVDAFEFLTQHKESYDLIFMRAVFEHIDKSRCIELLQLINESLKPKGKVMIDVPNMDWIFASHERYMDFTHESGYTQESLGQIMRNVFSDVKIKPVDNNERNTQTRRGWIKMRLARFILGNLIYWSEPVIDKRIYFSRALLGTGYKWE